MKILYVITKANWGGAQKYVYELATGAKAERHEVVVVYGNPPVGGGVLVEKLTAAGVRAIMLPGLERDVGVGREWRAFFALRRLLGSEQPDVVHLNSSKAGALGALAARLTRIPRIVFTAHGWAFNEARPRWQKMIIYKLVWWTVLLSHQTICVSEAVRRDVAWMPFIKKKLVVIYNGVHQPVYKTKKDARHLLWPGHEGGTWIGMLSELHPTKRIEDAVETLSIVHKTHSEVCLVVLGEGEERTKLRALIHARKLEGIVRLAGFISDSDTCLKAFDFFLHTSRSEALATAIIEAGLASLPVVATNVGGIPEIVEDGISGLLVPPHSPEKIADALLSLMNDSRGAERLGDTLRASAREHFSPARMLRETLALYITST